MISLPGQRATTGPAERGGAWGASPKGTAPGTGLGGRGTLGRVLLPQLQAPPGLGAGFRRPVSWEAPAPKGQAVGSWPKAAALEPLPARPARRFRPEGAWSWEGAEGKSRLCCTTSAAVAVTHLA